MTKYTEEFRLTVVHEYLKGNRGVGFIAGRHGIARGDLQKWVAVYRIHGAMGLCKKHCSYNAEFKLSVLQCMWANKLSYRKTAALYDIRNRGNLADWEKLYRRGGLQALVPRRKGRLKAMSDPGDDPLPKEDKRTREDLLAELDQLRMENAYLKKVEALVRAKQARKERK